MRHNRCDNVIAAIMAAPWAITREALEQIVAIASREESNINAALLAKQERAEKSPALRHGHTAVIPVFGPIFPRADIFQMVSGATSIACLTEELDAALMDPEVDSILLNIDSPGGQVTGVHEFAEHLAAAAKVKPLAAYVSGMATSAAYWLAIATGNVIADRTAWIGSIGVVYRWTDDSAARKAQGLRDFTIVSTQSPKKYLDSKTAEGKAEIQDQADALAKVFIAEVAEYRGVSEEKVMADFGQGGVALAEDALDRGMIDRVDVMAGVLAGFARSGDFYGQAIGGTAMAMQGNQDYFAAAAGGGKKRAKAQDDDDDDKKDPVANDDEEDDKDGQASAESDDDEKEKDDAEATGDDDDEDEEKDDPKAKRAAKKFKAENPRAHQAIMRQGMAAERRRIGDIYAIRRGGGSKMAEKAMFGSSMSAKDFAFETMLREQKARQQGLSDRHAESSALNVPLSVAGDPSASSEAAQIRAAINLLSECGKGQ